MSAREDVLARVRAALADVPDDEVPADVTVPRDYRTGPTGDDVLSLFAENVVDYGAEVRRAAPNDPGDAISRALLSDRITRILVPDGFPHQLLPHTPRLELVNDGADLTNEDLDAIDAVATLAVVGIAETGTVVLAAGEPGMGRRVASLLPDYHLCLIRRDQVVATVPEAMQRLAPMRDRPLTFVSGGSATSDIELVRVEGVHGPRRLVVVLDDH
jgi:L-lactate dehydrogenase complex protein LldG